MNAIELLKDDHDKVDRLFQKVKATEEGEEHKELFKKILILFAPFISLVEYISGEADLENKIANAHVLFNVLGVVLFVGFVPVIVKVLDKLIPDNQRNEDFVAESEAKATA
jgi:hypothetical protein